jgi:hypothetical protein
MARHVNVEAGDKEMADDELEDDDAEDNAGVEFENKIDEELKAPPPKRPAFWKDLSFGVVAFLLVLVALINLAMIVWFLLH